MQSLNLLEVKPALTLVNIFLFMNIVFLNNITHEYELLRSLNIFSNK